MTEQNISRRSFLGLLGGLTLVGVASACTTAESSDQNVESKKLEDLRAKKKYKEKTIEIGDNYFSPKQTTIEAGTIVIWKHIGRSLHNVISDDVDDKQVDSDRNFSSDTLKNGNIHVALFEKAGQYFYHCSFHGGPQRGHWGSITVDSTDRTP